MRFILIILASLMLSAPAFADVDCEQLPGHISCQDGGSGGGGGGGGDNTNTNDNTNDNTNTQGQQQGQIQGQIATGGSVGDTTATGGEGGSGFASIYIGGQSECYEEECEGGSAPFSNSNEVDNSSSADATTGDQTTNVNVNVGEDGPLTASSQAVETSASVAEGAVQIDNSSSSVYKESVRTAATSFSSVCTSGAAAQGNSYGLSVAVTSTQCSYLMQADAYMALGDIDKAMKYVDKAGRSASIKGFMSNIRTVVTLGIL